MVRWPFLVVLPVLALAGSGIAVTPPSTMALTQARAEQAAAQREAERLAKAASAARNNVARLAAERSAASADLAAAEARISAAGIELALRRQEVAMSERRLAERQAPAAALVAGLVNMGRRPPMLAIADGRSVTELVRVRSLLDATLPEIRARSAALRTELLRNRALERQAAEASDRLAQANRERTTKQHRLAALEAEGTRQAERVGFSALAAGDRMIAADERTAGVVSQGERVSAERRLAVELARLEPAATRPFKADSQGGRAPIAYRLPVDARIIEGTGSVSNSGIASRGITLASYAGAAVVMPADGSIAFSGPYGRHDGVVIIDHGGGWMTLLVGVRAAAPKGSTLAAGVPLGKALGPVTVELSMNGRPVSAAITALGSPVTGR